MTINTECHATSFHGNGNALELGNNTSLDEKYLSIEGSLSDQSLKKNKRQLDNSLNTINSLTGYNFDWNEKAGETLSGKSDIGLIAQEVEELLPEVVGVDDGGNKTVRYDKIVPVLVESIKTLTEQVKDLQDQLNNM